jgi:hypothetical protein
MIFSIGVWRIARNDFSAKSDATSTARFAETATSTRTSPHPRRNARKSGERFRATALGCFRSQVVGVGPQVGYIFRVCEMHYSIARAAVATTERSFPNGSLSIFRAFSSDSIRSNACSCERTRQFLDSRRAMLSARSRGRHHSNNAWRDQSGVD